MIIKHLYYLPLGHNSNRLHVIITANVLQAALTPQQYGEAPKPNGHAKKSTT